MEEPKVAHRQIRDLRGGTSQLLFTKIFGSSRNGHVDYVIEGFTTPHSLLAILLHISLSPIDKTCYLILATHLQLLLSSVDRT